MLFVFAGAAVLVFCLDIILKQGVEELLWPEEERELADGRLFLRKVYNRGAVLNFMERRPDILRRISAVLGSATLLYDAILLCRPGRFLEKTGMMLFTGGAFSNIFDRFARGKVIDYIGFQTKWPKLTAVTYNLGDFALFTGTILCLTSRLPEKIRKRLAKKK